MTTQRNSRRTVLKILGAGTAGGLVVGTGSVASRRQRGSSGALENLPENPKPSNHDLHEGDPATVEVEDGDDGEVLAYATTNPAGKLSSIGVHLDAAAFAAFDEKGGHRDEPFAAHLHSPDVDTHQFTFNGFHYNPEGHPPPEIYTVPHFDFHFYFIEESVVEAIDGGPMPDQLPFVGLADYDIPDEQFPPGYNFEKHRLIVRQMGEHLLDGTAPEFQGEDFTHTNAYGVWDPSVDLESKDGCEDIQELDLEDVPVYRGDGEGRLQFVEPMVTTDFISDDLDEETEVEIATPDVFPVADDYPTTYVVQPDGEGGVYVSIDGFEAFPGPS